MKTILPVLMILVLLNPFPGIGAERNQKMKSSASCATKALEQDGCSKSKNADASKNCTYCIHCPLVMSFISPALSAAISFVYSPVLYPDLKQDQLKGFNNSIWRPPAVV